MKAVIPAAGFGTRFLPVTKAVPKELLPVGDLPVIHHVAEEAAAAGFDEILIILSRGKEAIRRYFTPDPELEEHLIKCGKPELLERVRAISRMADFHFVYQEEMLGLGHAILQARSFVAGGAGFAVLLGDTILHGESPLPHLRKIGEAKSCSSVALEPCPGEKVSRYGVAGGAEVAPGIFQLEKMVEKPSADIVPVLRGLDGKKLPPHAFTARYFFTSGIFACLEAASAGHGGEIQLTDAMEQLRYEEGFFGVRSQARRLDVGNPVGLLEANQLLASPACSASSVGKISKAPGSKILRQRMARTELRANSG